MQKRTIPGHWKNAVTGETREDHDLPLDDRQHAPWKWQRGYVEVLCCGVWLRCEHFTNTCERCDSDYNHGGQRLAPRDQWGEETGESLADILSVDCDVD